MDAIAYPFRFSGGRTAKINAGTDAFRAQTVAAALRTGTGELFLTPTYGTRSPEFGGLDMAGFTYTLATFHPTIIVDKIEEIVNPETGMLDIRIEFSSTFDRGL